MRTDILKSKDLILTWISENKPKAFICKQLMCKPLTLDMYLEKMGITYKGNQGRRGNFYPERRISAIEYMKKDCVQAPKLRQLLIRDGLKEAKCENPKCGIVEWIGVPAPLELHHKDGNRFNNDISNLQILCSNCHSLTENHSGKSAHTKCEVVKVKLPSKSKRTVQEYHDDVIKSYNEQQEKYIPIVENSDIDFTKFGWVTKLAPIIDKRPQKVNEWMKRFMPQFYNDKCFKRKNS